MPVNYQLKNLRRLFGEVSFLRPAGDSPAVPLGKVARVTRWTTSDPPQKRSKSLGGTPRAFFSEQPPRSIRNKAVSSQLYSIHLIEKQKMRLYYGAIRDSKFKKYVEEAANTRHNVDAHLIRLLEGRLDTFLYRTSFVKTPAQARQWIYHGHVLVNGDEVNVKSFRMRPGDIVTIAEHHHEHALRACMENAQMRQGFGCGASWIVSHADVAGMLPWMEIDRVGLSAVMVRYPTDDEARSMTRAALFPFIRDANLKPLAAMRAYR
ncbi:unnamed protein product [Agarophyton chilense]